MFVEEQRIEGPAVFCSEEGDVGYTFSGMGAQESFQKLTFVSTYSNGRNSSNAQFQTVRVRCPAIFTFGTDYILEPSTSVI